MSASERQLAAINDAAVAKAARIAREKRRADRLALRDEVLADERSASEIQAGLLREGRAVDEPRRRRTSARSGSTTTPD